MDASPSGDSGLRLGHWLSGGYLLDVNPDLKSQEEASKRMRRSGIEPELLAWEAISAGQRAQSCIS
jgi:hypothetical protein